MGTIVGIDLGTTNSLVAICDERGPRVLGAIVPSVVRYADSGVVVGQQAREAAIDFPLETVSSAKRLMGRSLDEVGADAKYLTARVVEGDHGQARVELPGGRRVTPQEVSAEILKTLRDVASDELDEPIERAVVTVPAYFDDAQRQATRDAGRLAGLDVVRIVNEPTAAALAYGLGLERDAERNLKSTVAVYDLGGGTFDVSILRLTPGDKTSFFQVVSTAGDTRLGGDDVDHMLVDLFFGEMRERFGLDLASYGDLPAATRRALTQFAEAVKHRLSDEPEARVQIALGEDRVYDRTVTRDEFEAMIAPWVARTIDSCDRALRDAERTLAGDEIDAVVMVGGSTRIPLVRRRVGEKFGLEPYTALDPDRVVALGAAVQGAILSGTRKGALLLDVIPLSLGIETVGGAMAKLIMRNSAVPARAVERFSTSVDGQTSIKLHVVQGEREMVEDCRSLGEFHLSGLPPMPAGIPQLEVEFLVDANGVLEVHAHEKRSGKRAALQIVPNHGLTHDEVDRIEAESYEHARDDMTRHRVVDLVTNAKLDLKWIGERLERHRDKLEASYAQDLDAKIGALRGMVERAEADWQAVDAEAFAKAKQDLDESSVRLQEVSIAESLKDDDRS